MPDAKDTRRQRASTPIAHEQFLVVIDGGSIVEAYTKRRLLHDLVIRQRHDSSYVVDPKVGRSFGEPQPVNHSDPRLINPSTPPSML